MAKIGHTNKVSITNIDEHNTVIDAGSLGEIVLSNKDLPENSKVGDEINVFIYHDSKERLAATTKKVRAEAGEVAYLNVVQVNRVGAFLDWGIPKDLLVPFNQQQLDMQVGKSYLVYVYLDEETNRVVASSKLHRFIEHPSSVYRRGESVELIISDTTDIGYSAVINNQHWGVLFFNDVVKAPRKGQKLKGYIKEVRDDGKINLSLQPIGYAKVDGVLLKVLKQLENNDGFLPLSDKSPAQSIYDQFGVSKKSFKMAIGSLYKQRLITISKEGIRLI